jgi:hypothetical protein
MRMLDDTPVNKSNTRKLDMVVHCSWAYDESYKEQTKQIKSSSEYQPLQFPSTTPIQNRVTDWLHL